VIAMNLTFQRVDFSFCLSTFAKENLLYNLHMIYFVIKNSPKENKIIGAQNKMIDIIKCSK
jgi:hypothetical protein